MATQYSWEIKQMEVKPQDGNLNDVVTVVHWLRSATATETDKTYTASVYGAMGCGTPSETDFTAYPDLTFEQVCGWLEAGLDVLSLDANLDNQIANQINPPIVILPIPWQ